MATSWGIDPLKDVDGNVTIGTSSSDIRQIFGTLYSAGLISGGLVTRSASDMTYTISNGVAAYPIVADNTLPYKPENQRTVVGPVPYTVLTTSAAVSGTRLDIIYAQQRTVALNGDPNIVVAIGTTLPENAVLLDAFIVTTTATNTNSLVRSSQVKYSIPYGASLGILYQHRSTYNGIINAFVTDGTGSFYLPTDRLVRFSLNASLSSGNISGVASVGFDNAKYSEAQFEIFLGSTKLWTWSSVGLHQAWAEHDWSELYTLPQGTHTVSYRRSRAQGPGYPIQRYKGGNVGNLFQVQDIGPVQ